MKKLEFLIDFFDIKKSTFLVLLLAFLTGQFKTILLFLAISFIHEIGHLISCLFFKIKLKKINVLPFGFNLEIEDYTSLNSLQEMIIYASGPFTFFISNFLIIYLYNNQILSEISFQYAKNANLVINLFNLLPIYPLDGFRILNSILQFFFKYKISLKSSALISIIAFILLIVYTIKTPQIVIVIFLFLMQYKYLKEIPFLYKKFLINKTYPKKHKHYKIINNYEMYKDKNNYKMEKGKIINDQQISNKLLKQSKYL